MKIVRYRTPIKVLMKKLTKPKGYQSKKYGEQKN